MFAVGIVEVLVVLLLLVGTLALVTVLVVRSVLSSAEPVTVTREWRLVQITRVVGTVVGVLAGWQVFERGSYGTGPLLAPAVFGLCVVTGVTLGETLVRPRRAAGNRSASLSTRRVRDYLPRTTTILVAVVLALEICTLILTTVTASYDDYTRGTRALVCEGPAGYSSSQTPYPGSYYSVPLTLVLIAVLVVAGLAARQVVRRPRGMSTTDAGDDVLRLRSCRVVVASTGVAVCAPFTAIALIAGGAMRGLGSCAPGWAEAAGTLLLWSSLLALVVGLWCAVQLITPGARSAEVAAHEPVDR